VAEKIYSVSIGGIAVSASAADVLVAYGLGSCVAICLYDPVSRIGGMLHALLPSAPSQNGRNPAPSAKFVDLGTPLLIEALLGLGARRGRLSAQLCGGAQVLSAPGFEEGELHIGKRNVSAAESALRNAHIPIKAQRTGGRVGRTVRFYIATGQVTVRSLGQKEQVLTTNPSQEVYDGHSHGRGRQLVCEKSSLETAG
jgi:chemotaxis protein CheD